MYLLADRKEQTLKPKPKQTVPFQIEQIENSERKKKRICHLYESEKFSQLEQTLARYIRSRFSAEIACDNYCRVYCFCSSKFRFVHFIDRLFVLRKLHLHKISLQRDEFRFSSFFSIFQNEMYARNTH